MTIRISFIVMLVFLLNPFHLIMSKEIDGSPVALIGEYRELYFDDQIPNTALLNYFLSEIKEAYDAEISSGERFLGNSNLASYVLDAPVLIRKVDSTQVVDCDSITIDSVPIDHQCVEIRGLNKYDIYFSVILAFKLISGEWKISYTQISDDKSTKGKIIRNDK